MSTIENDYFYKKTKHFSCGVIFNTLNIILHKKTRHFSIDEIITLEREIEKLGNCKISKRVSKLLDMLKRGQPVPSHLIKEVCSLETLKGTPVRPMEIKTDNFEVKLINLKFRIPSLDFYVCGANDLTEEMGILCSVCVVQNDTIATPHFMVHKEVCDKNLYAYVNNGKALDIQLLIILSQCSDSLFLPLEMFIDCFDVLKMHRARFRYISVYGCKSKELPEHDKLISEDSTDKIISELYSNFKK